MESWTEKVVVRQARDREDCWLWGSCSLPDGGWLVTDWRNRAVKRLAGNNRVIDHCNLLGLGLCGVCYIPEHNMAAIATGPKNIVDIISLGDTMKIVRSICTSHDCYGVAYCGKMLYVTAFEGKEVYEYKFSTGKLKRTICPRDGNGQKIFSWTRYIVANESTSRLYVTDAKEGVVILDTRTGNVLKKVDIGGHAAGICLGEDGSLFARVLGPARIIQLSQDCRVLDVVVTSAMMEGLPPWSVSFDRNTSRLIVTVGRGIDNIFVFHLK